MSKRRATGVNQAPFDKYSSAHAGFGAVFAAYGVSFWGAAAISILFETFENGLKDTYPKAFPYSSHDSVENSVGDTASLLGAYVITSAAMKRGLSAKEKRALKAAIGSTLGGFFGAVALGVLMSEESGIGEQAATWGDRGYTVGTTVGAVVGSRRVSEKGAPALAAGAGGYLAGPVGAALLALMT